MAEAHLVRNLPARELVVTGPADAALATAVAAFTAEKFVQRSEPGSFPVIFEYGSRAGYILSGLGLGLLPGRIGKRGWALVDTAPGEGATTTLTISLLTGRQVGSSVRAVIERTRGALEAAGVLVSAGEPISAHDLPLSSPGNPQTFRERGYLVGSDRWMNA